jgi:hypothetical protein
MPTLPKANKTGTGKKGQNNYNFVNTIHREEAPLLHPLCASSKRVHPLNEEETGEVYFSPH